VLELPFLNKFTSLVTHVNHVARLLKETEQALLNSQNP